MDLILFNTNSRVTSALQSHLAKWSGLVSSLKKQFSFTVCWQSSTVWLLIIAKSEKSSFILNIIKNDRIVGRISFQSDKIMQWVVLMRNHTRIHKMLNRYFNHHFTNEMVFDQIDLALYNHKNLKKPSEEIVSLSKSIWMNQ